MEPDRRDRDPDLARAWDVVAEDAKARARAPGAARAADEGKDEASGAAPERPRKRVKVEETKTKREEPSNER